MLAKRELRRRPAVVVRRRPDLPGRKGVKTVKKWIVIATTALALAGCNTRDRTTQGALLGGATGAVVGGVATGSAGGAVAGGAIGAVGGAIIADQTRPRCYYSRYYERTVCRQ